MKFSEKYYGKQFVMDHFYAKNGCEGTITYKGKETAIVCNDTCSTTVEFLVEHLLQGFEDKSMSESASIIESLAFAGVVVDGLNGKKDSHMGMWHEPMRLNTVIWYEDGYRHEYRP